MNHLRRCFGSFSEPSVKCRQLSEQLFHRRRQRSWCKHQIGDVELCQRVKCVGSSGADKLNVSDHNRKISRIDLVETASPGDDDDFEEISNLEMFLDEIPDYLALGISTEYQKIKLAFSNREDIDG